MKQIELTKGYDTQIDDIDNDLNDENWYAQEHRGRVYAVRMGKNWFGKRKQIPMHRVILERKLGRKLLESEMPDHLKGNGLDNRRDNLRLATRTQNVHNQKIHNNNTSGYKGVHWEVSSQKWRAQISVNGMKINLHLFTDAIEAAKAYDQAARKLHGEFASTNF